MAAQAVDAALVSAAQGLSGAVSGGSNSVNVQEPLRETGAKSKTTRKSLGIKTRKTTRTRPQPKHNRMDVSHSSGSIYDSVNPLVLIPCRIAGCSLTFSSIIVADSHVRQAHAPPRVDSLEPSRSLVNSSSPRIVGVNDSHIDQLSPQSISPKQCNSCQKFFSSDIDLV